LAPNVDKHKWTPFSVSLFTLCAIFHEQQEWATRREGNSPINLPVGKHHRRICEVTAISDNVKFPGGKEEEEEEKGKDEEGEVKSYAKDIKGKVLH
jgi:hypothetical protein